jgi:AIR synthase-related protein
MSLQTITSELLAGRGFAHKRDISDAMSEIERNRPALSKVLTGDDCAAIPDGNSYLLFAIEGFVDDFVKSKPWFAGYCGVMVNVSDIYAMGGRPIAIVDAIWSAGLEDSTFILQGMCEASNRYNVPIVGGHTNHRSNKPQLAVAVLGRASKLLTSFDAKPGERLLMAVDLRGEYHGEDPYWNASTTAPPERLRADLELLPELAESDLCHAAKDISMAGAIGTALMLLECSSVGAEINLDAIPKPPGVDLTRWLQSFPSYGFVLSVSSEKANEVINRFTARGIACAQVGEVTRDTGVWLKSGHERELLWDVANQPFIQAAKTGTTEQVNA